MRVVELSPGFRVKNRDVVVTAILSLVTIYVYAVWWWHDINRELRDLGRTRGARDLGDNPMNSAIAVSLGWLLVVPALVSGYNTCRRIRSAQRIAGVAELNPWMAPVLFVLFPPAFVGYLQSQLNHTWDALEKTAVGAGAYGAGAPDAAAPVAPAAIASNGTPTVPELAEVPPNWYPDPSGSARLRFWDGNAWTAHTAD